MMMKHFDKFIIIFSIIVGIYSLIEIYTGLVTLNDLRKAENSPTKEIVAKSQTIKTKPKVLKDTLFYELNEDRTLITRPIFNMEDSGNYLRQDLALELLFRGSFLNGKLRDTFYLDTCFAGEKKLPCAVYGYPDNLLYFPWQGEPIYYVTKIEKNHFIIISTIEGVL